MKIYFAGSIRGGRGDKALYLKIIGFVQKYGTVLTEHIGSQDLTAAGENKPAEFIYQRDSNWLKEADVVVAEVSTPSLGVGYELGLAERLGKKIICLYRLSAEKSLSGMVAGNRNFTVINYKNTADLFPQLAKILA